MSAAPAKPAAKPAPAKPASPAKIAPDDTADKKNHNLLILGLVSVAIALVTTTVSIFVYHSSGDIYLDRSRPGFLPDKKEIEKELKEDYSFSENNEINNETLETFLTNYKEVLDDLDKTPDPFADDTLSNESLDISADHETVPETVAD